MSVMLAYGLLVAVACSIDNSPISDSTGGTESITEGPLLLPTLTPSLSMSMLQNPIWFISPSIEEQIFMSDVVVRASLISTKASVETVPSEEGVAPTYLPKQVLRFQVHEYLKGKGLLEITVEVSSDQTYLTTNEAQEIAQLSVSRRNTTWDDREAILFLNENFLHKETISETEQGAGEAGEKNTAPKYYFTRYNPLESAWAYSIDTLSRAWLPSQDTPPAVASAEGSSSALQSFITDGSQSPHPIISLTELRDKIVQFEARMKAGEGIPGFSDCIYNDVIHERYRRILPYTVPKKSIVLASGIATRTEIDRWENTDQNPKYDRFWLTGLGAEFFQAIIEDVDSKSQNGYAQTITTMRPLREGVYKFQKHWQHYRDIPCNHVVEPSDDITVTITAPAGTLHEAFFDPGAEGGAVGFSSKAGRLEPAGFSVGGTAVEMQALRWRSGSVSLTLSPAASLSGYALDFIVLDGSIALTLKGADASPGAGAGELTWAVTAQPWQDGDLLMLRIRETDPVPGATPTPGLTPVATPTPVATATPAPTATPSATATPAPETPQLPSLSVS